MNTTEAVAASRTPWTKSACQRLAHAACLLAMLSSGACLAGPQDSTAHTKPTGNEERRLLSSLQKQHPGTRFTDIARTEVTDLYEVWMGDAVAYVSSRNPRYFVFGRLYDTQAARDITGPKLAQKAAAAEGRQVSEVAPPSSPPFTFDQLPFSDALKTVRGKGQRRVAVISDPNCIYCKQLEAELAGLEDVTIHTFMVPFQGESRPIAIWCAADKERAWQQWMLKGDASLQLAATACDHPIARNLALARRLGVQGTPTLLWPDGTRTEGFANRAEVEARMAATAAKPGQSERLP